jgi:hypothetical protein
VKAAAKLARSHGHPLVRWWGGESLSLTGSPPANSLADAREVADHGRGVRAHGDPAAGGEGRGRDVSCVEAVKVAVGSEPHEGPRHESQRRDAQGSTCGRHPGQHASAMRAFGLSARRLRQVIEKSCGGRLGSRDSAHDCETRGSYARFKRRRTTWHLSPTIPSACATGSRIPGSVHGLHLVRACARAGRACRPHCVEHVWLRPRCALHADKARRTRGRRACARVQGARRKRASLISS